jgi:hypothetical protein
MEYGSSEQGVWESEQGVWESEQGVWEDGSINVKTFASPLLSYSLFIPHILPSSL